MKYTGKNIIKIKKFTRARIYLMITFSVFFIISLFTILTIDTGNINIRTAFKDFGKNIVTMFFKPHFSNRYIILEVFESLAVTLSLAMLTTLLGAVAALFLAFFASENLSGKWTVKIIRVTVSFIRAVPTILWVMVFSIVANIGVEAAVIGMSFHSVAYLVKAYSESIEELDTGVIEALKAGGASKWQIIFQSVIPSTATSLLSWTFVRFEINFSNAVVVGAASGAGGIGYEMFMAGTMYYDLSEVGMFAYLVLITAIILEIVSYFLRTKYLKLK